MQPKEAARRWFLHTALSYLGTPYIWGGDDPSGFDCSGFVIECLKSAGLVDEDQDLTADGLLRRCCDRTVQKPRTGALLFDLSEAGERATHVEICLDEYFQIGAGGGGRHVKDRATAWKDNAYVRIRPIGPLSGRVKLVDPFLGKKREPPA
ncbi:MAG: C40 family peptidase [Candidatus Zixiibacteriota bacterium]|nr:MAG: C40 family peptidase [candidate division Zixibacteria bacterium]